MNANEWGDLECQITITEAYSQTAMNQIKKSSNSDFSIATLTLTAQ